jgi:hypothetical protein
MELSFKCEFCGKLFAKEKTLFVHVCEQKRRNLAKDEKHVQMGLMTFQKFSSGLILTYITISGKQGLCS